MLTVDERQPTHLCDFVRSKMSNSDFAEVFNVESDCVCVVKTLVLGALSFKPQVTCCSKQGTRASSMLRTFVQILPKFSLAPHPSIHCSFAMGIPTMKGKIENVGFGLGDAFCNVVCVRFGVQTFDEFVKAVGHLGLRLNVAGGAVLGGATTKCL